jgi:DNA-binding transcriptional ArsR family regulator
MVRADVERRALLEFVARRVQAAAHAERLWILLLLDERELSVQEVADVLGVTHQAASNHLRVLHRVGLVASTKVGTRAMYRIEDVPTFEVVRGVIESSRLYVQRMDAAVRGTSE